MTLRPCKAAADCTGHYLVMVLTGIAFCAPNAIGYIYEVHQTIALIVAGQITDDNLIDQFIANNELSEANFEEWRKNDKSRKGFIRLQKENKERFLDWQSNILLP